MRIVPLVLGIAGLLLAACREAPPLPERPTTLETYPHAMDRLARLMREEFHAADPLPVEAQIHCENARVAPVLGADFRRRLILLQDSLRMEFTSEQFNQLSLRLRDAPANPGYDPRCRAFDADAEGEAPLGAGRRGKELGSRNSDRGTSTLRRGVPGDVTPRAASWPCLLSRELAMRTGH